MTTIRIRIAKYAGSMWIAATEDHMERRVASESADLLAPSRKDWLLASGVTFK
jgi:hypothetical protein